MMDEGGESSVRRASQSRHEDEMPDVAFAPARRLADVAPSGIRAIFDRAAELEQTGVHVCHMEIGRPDFDTPRHIKAAAVEALDRGAVHYASNWGVPALRGAIGRKLLRENGLTYSPDDEIIVTIGANEAILLAMMAFVDPGDEVVIPSPAWLHYAQCARLAGGVPVTVPLRAEEGYRLRPDDLAAALSPRTRIVVLNSPGNPTGAVLDEARLREIAIVLGRSGAIVLSDEIYEHMVYDGARHVSPAGLPGMPQRTVVVSGFAKAYAMDGWRLGYLAAPRELAKWALRVHQYTAVCAPTFEQYGAAAALDGPQETRDAMVAEFARRRSAALDVLRAQDVVRYAPAEGAFYLWVTYPDAAPPADDLALGLLEDRHVATVSGTTFDPKATHSLRLAYSCPSEDVVEGIRRLVAYVRERTPTAVER
jgi:aminotransferase